jgi:hypothetical protein
VVSKEWIAVAICIQPDEAFFGWPGIDKDKITITATSNAITSESHQRGI